MAEIPEADVTNSTSNDYPHTDLKEESDKCNTRSDAPRAGSFNALLFLQVLLGILCAFKPAEPFVVPYYIDNGISMDQINQTVFPMSGYSNFGFLLVLSMASIGISHHALLYFGWVGYVVCYTLLIFVDKLIVAILPKSSTAWQSPLKRCIARRFTF